MKILTLGRQRGKTKEVINKYLTLKECRVDVIILTFNDRNKSILVNRIRDEVLERAGKYYVYSIYPQPDVPLYIKISDDIKTEDEYKRPGFKEFLRKRGTKIIIDDLNMFQDFKNVVMITASPEVAGREEETRDCVR
jgi:hypothetical protein